VEIDVLCSHALMFSESLLPKSEMTSDIHSDYCTIITQIEIVVVFGIMSPLLLPITIVALDANVFWYRKMRERNFGFKDWRDESSFPIPFLLFSLICEQLLLSIFCYYAFHHLYSLFLVLFLLIIDLLFVGLFVRHKYSENVVNVRQATVWNVGDDD